MTEEQAKTKWCPMFRNDLNSTSAHTLDDGGRNAGCIGSECMMWHSVPLVNPHHHNEFSVPSEAGWVWDDQTGDWKMSAGYCGLAGKP